MQLDFALVDVSTVRENCPWKDEDVLGTGLHKGEIFNRMSNHFLLLALYMLLYSVERRVVRGSFIEKFKHVRLTES